jgi:carotenoid cleavage dioxygenase
MALNSTIANTNIVWHGGKLLALEEAHAPFALDPASLMPKGYETWGDKLCGPFTAHPKIDPKTGEMVFFGYSAKGRFTKEVSIQAVTEDGKVTRGNPRRPFQHDPRLRRHRNWIVVPSSRSQLDGRAMAGLPPFAWEPDKGTHIASSRNGTWPTPNGSRARLLRFHPMNHFETDDGRS